MTETIIPEQLANDYGPMTLADRFDYALEESARSLVVLSQYINFDTKNVTKGLSDALCAVSNIVEEIIFNSDRLLTDEAKWRYLASLEPAMMDLVAQCNNLGINGKSREQDTASEVVRNLTWHITLHCNPEDSNE